VSHVSAELIVTLSKPIASEPFPDATRCCHCGAAKGNGLAPAMNEIAQPPLFEKVELATLAEPAEPWTTMPSLLLLATVTLLTMAVPESLIAEYVWSKV